MQRILKIFKNRYKYVKTLKTVLFGTDIFGGKSLLIKVLFGDGVLKSVRNLFMVVGLTNLKLENFNAALSSIQNPFIYYCQLWS